MKILLAVSERDLLVCLKRMLELGGNTVIAAFDGVQAVSALDAERPDIAVIYEKLPRVSPARLINALNEKGVPSVTLTTSVIGEKTLCVESVPSSFLAFPFAPEELRGKLDAVCKKSLFGARYEICGVTVDEKRFVLGSSGVTCEELDILSAVTRGEKIVSEDAHMYASAINTKLASERAGATIKYLKNQGYRLVNENE